MDRMKTKRERGGGKALLPALAVLAVLAFASIAIATSACSDAEDSGGAEPADPSEVELAYIDSEGNAKTVFYSGLSDALNAAWNLRGGDNAVWRTAVVTLKESITARGIDAWKVPKLVIGEGVELKCSGDIKTSMPDSTAYGGMFCRVENAGTISANMISGDLDRGGGIVNSGTVECNRFLAKGNGWSNSGTIISNDLKLDRFRNTGSIQARDDGAIMTVLGTPVKIGGVDYIGVYTWSSPEGLWKESGSIEVWKDDTKLTTYNYMPDAYVHAEANGGAHTFKLASDMNETYRWAPAIVIKIDLTLDLNGHRCSYPDNLIVDSGGSLTIKDSAATFGEDGAYVSGTAEFGTSSKATDAVWLAVWVKEGGSFTMDSGRLVSNGRRPAVLVAGNLSGSAGVSSAAVAVNGGVIENTCSDGYDESSAPFNVPSAILILGTGNSTATGPALAVTGGEVKCDHGIAIMGSRDRGNTSIEISGGKVSSIDMPAVYHPQLGELAVTGGEVSGWTGIAVKGGDVDISGNADVAGTGTFVQPVSIPEAWTSNPGCAVYLETGFGHHAAVAISGGGFSAGEGAPAALLYGEAGDAVLAITGGTFTSDPSDYVDKTNYSVVGLEDGRFMVIEGSAKYTVTWKDWNGDVLKTDEEVPYGKTLAYNGLEPAKESTAEFEFTFSGWNPEPAPVSGDVTYTAVYTETVRTYTVTWKDWNGDVLVTEKDVPYGTAVAWKGASVPVRELTPEFDYTFTGWEPALDESTTVTGDMEFLAQFDSVKRSYEIAFVVDGTRSVQNVEYGATPAYDGTPAKEADVQYTYAFDGWEPKITAVSGPATYTAVFSGTLRTYAVIWKNWDEKVLKTDEAVPYGETPAYSGEDPVRESTAQYSYAFSGWSPEISAVAGDVTYTAVYTETIRTYTVTWKDGDAVLATEEEVPYGAAVAWRGESAPVREPTAEFEYAFAGWSPAVDESTVVTGDMEFLAQFDSVKRSYDIVFIVDGVETVKSVEYGATPVYDGTPAKEADAQYTYAFERWDPEIAAVSEPAMYTAVFSGTLRTYTVTFDSNGGSEVPPAIVEYGKPVPKPSDPAREGYTFVGWQSSDGAAYDFNASVKGDMTLVAAWEGKPYELTFTDVGRPDHSVTGRCGDKVQGPAWSKDGYGLSWGPDFDGTVPAHNAVYKAVWTAKEYRVVFHTVDNYYSQTFTFDAPAELRSAGTRAGYAFGGWAASEGGSVKYIDGQRICVRPYIERIDLYAVWTAETYAVSAAPAENGTVGVSPSAECGSTVIVTLSPAEGYVVASLSAEPAVAFSGDGDVRTFTMPASDVVITATFAKSLCTVTWKDGDVILATEENVPYGTAVVWKGASLPARESTAEFEYAFAGWNPAVDESTTVIGDMEFLAQFDSVKRSYDIVFIVDGVETVKSVEYGATPAYDGVPVKEADVQYTYAFDGWEPEIVAVSGPATYTAVFKQTVNSYVVTWKDWDGAVLETDDAVPYGEVPTFDGAIPVREPTAEFSYVFDKWTPNVVAVAGDAEYVATYIEIPTSAPEIASIEISVLPEKIAYEIGERFDPAGLAVAGVYADGQRRMLSSSEYTVDAPVLCRPGDFTVAVRYADLSAEFTVSVAAPEPAHDVNENDDGSTTTSDTEVEESEGGTVVVRTEATEHPDGTRTEVKSETAYAPDGSVTETSATSSVSADGATSERTETVKTDVSGAEVEKKVIAKSSVTLRDADGNAVATVTVESVTRTAADVSESVERVAFEAADGGIGTVVESSDGKAKAVTTVRVVDGMISMDIVSGAVAQADGALDRLLSPPESIERTVAVETGAGTSAAFAPEAVRAVAGSGAGLEVSGDNGSVSVGAAICEKLASEAEARIEIVLTHNDNATLNEVQKDAIGGRHFIDLSAIADGVKVHELGGTAVVEFSYELRDGELAENMAVFYVDDSGAKELVDSEYRDGRFTMETDHFSVFVVEDTAAGPETGRTYAVTWKNWNGDVLLEETVEEGAIPVYTGDAPAREADAQYTYAFSGWGPEVVAVVEDVEYTAVFKQTVRTYTVTVAAGEHGSVDIASIEAPYGTAVTADGCKLTIGDTVFTATPDEAYIFASWMPAVEDGATVVGNVTYTAVFAEAGKTYTVTWRNWNGDVLFEDVIEAGAVPVYAGEAPLKDADAQFTYAFSGWDPEVAAAVADVEYTAVFKQIVRTYTVTVLAGEHGSVDAASVEVEYGAAVSVDGCRLTVGDTVFTATPDDAYAFEKWTPAIEDGATVAGDVTYTAVFAAEIEPEPEPEDDSGDSAILYVGIAAAAVLILALAVLLLRRRS